MKNTHTLTHTKDRSNESLALANVWNHCLDEGLWSKREQAHLLFTVRQPESPRLAPKRSDATAHRQLSLLCCRVCQGGKWKKKTRNLLLRLFFYNKVVSQVTQGALFFSCLTDIFSFLFYCTLNPIWHVPHHILELCGIHLCSFEWNSQELLAYFVQSVAPSTSKLHRDATLSAYYNWLSRF